ncbi:MAG TPA: Uma2 family endonuclease [Chthoniobacter sp.]|jgi:Uma2 family endonuclease
MAAVLNHPSASKHWTFADLAQFDETERYEVYDGRLIPMAPSPDFSHQQISARLHLILAGFVKPRQLGEVVFAPMDVVFAEDNTAQPDLLFIAKENLGIVRRSVFGAPDLIVEILSPSSIRRDRYEKLEQYARFGVKEYWVIDPASRSFEILMNQNHRFVVHSNAAETGTVESKVLAGLVIDLVEVF